MAKLLGQFKTGDYFSFYADMPEYTGLLENIKCQVRNSSDSLIADLDVAKDVDTAGRYIFSAGNIDWATGTYSLDIQTEVDGKRSSTETFNVKIVKDITR